LSCIKRGKLSRQVERPFTLTRERLARQLGRENTMFETRNQALGGSATAQNLADSAALGDAATLAHSVMTGGATGMGRAALTFVGNLLRGSTPAVRSAVAQRLLQTGGNVSAGDLVRTLETVTRQVQQRDFAGRAGGSIAARLAAQYLNNRPASGYQSP